MTAFYMQAVFNVEGHNFMIALIYEMTCVHEVPYTSSAQYLRIKRKTLMDGILSSNFCEWSYAHGIELSCLSILFQLILFPWEPSEE